MINETQYHVDLGGKLNGIRLVVSLLMREIRTNRLRDVWTKSEI